MYHSYFVFFLTIILLTQELLANDKSVNALFGQPFRMLAQLT